MHKYNSIYTMPIRHLLSIDGTETIQSYSNMKSISNPFTKKDAYKYWNIKFKQCLNLEKSIVQIDSIEYLVLIDEKVAYQINK